MPIHRSVVVTLNDHLPILVSAPGTCDEDAEDYVRERLEAGPPRTVDDVLALIEPPWPTWGSLERERFADALLTRLAH